MWSRNKSPQYEIGGYFGFDITSSPSHSFPYKQAHSFNSARSAFFVLLEQLQAKSILMPRFICNSMLKPLLMLNIRIHFYEIDDTLYPLLPNNLEKDCFILYVNYFGVCTGHQAKLLSKYPAERLIFDNAQAFFVEPFDNVHTIYSPRKFLPIADGGFLITKKTISKIELEHESISEDVLLQYQHLFKRLIYGANKGYADFLEIEESFNNEIPGNLSPLTEKFLDTFSYTALRKKRLENFLFLHEKLASYNQLVINIEEVASPLTYPFMYTNAKRFTDKLISNSIYSPVYWTDCLERISENMFEDLLIKHTTHLICDHRYNVSDMEYQLELIMSYLL